MTLSEEAAELGMAFVETFTRGKSATVDVYDATGEGFSVYRPDPAARIVSITSYVDEHPGDLARRALSEARRRQMRVVR